MAVARPGLLYGPCVEGLSTEIIQTSTILHLRLQVGLTKICDQCQKARGWPNHG